MATEDRDQTTAENFFVSTAGADVWGRGQAQRSRYLGPATELMLDLARLKPGSRVLDVAAGSGEQSLLALLAVGPTGSVLATDISATMLQQADSAAREAGWENLETRVMDANDLDLPAESFDAVISRLGLMFVPNLRRTLAGISRGLVPGGRLAAIVWGPLERNQNQLISRVVASRYVPAREVEERQAPSFSLSDAERLASELRSAGFGDVRVRSVDASRHFESASVAAVMVMESSPSLNAVLSHLSADQRSAVVHDLETELRQFEGPDGCICPGEVIVVAGTKGQVVQ